MTMEAAPAVDEEAPEGAAPEIEAAETEVDPAAELAARFDRIEAEQERLRGLDPSTIRSALGRISSLQSSIDDIAKRDPAAALDPRVSASENALVGIAETLLNDPGIGDATRTALTTAIRGVEQARSQRELDRREAALEARVRAAVVPPEPAPEAAEETVAARTRASATVARRATALGIDPQTLPWTEFRAKSDGSLEDAVAVATEWLQEHRVDAPAERVSARRAAAGAGAPARSGGEASNTLDYDALKKMGVV